MKKVLLGFLGVVVGLLVGSVLNMALINLNMSLHGPPEELDFKDSAKVEAFMRSMPLLGFLIVGLAHQSQAFVGSLIGSLIAGRRSVVVGLIIGVATLAGCVMAIFLFPGAQLWFSVIDVLLPVPLAYLAARLVIKKNA